MNYPIRNWSKDYWFLDNSYEVPIAFEGLMYPSVTHAFVGAQAGDLDLKIEISHAPLSAIDGYFEKIQEAPVGFRGPDIMRKLLEYKFGIPQLQIRLTPHQVKMALKLVVTGKTPLIFGNANCNQFWGDCSCPKHKDIAGKNILGGLLMGVRERLIESITYGVARTQNCNCENVNIAFFLYVHDGKLWIKPFCDECQAQTAIFLAKLADNNEIHRFEKDWFKDPKGPSSSAKKAVNRQIMTVYPPFDEAGNSFESNEYAQQWAAAIAAWNRGRQGAKEEPKLAQNITFYLSGKIS